MRKVFQTHLTIMETPVGIDRYLAWGHTYKHSPLLKDTNHRKAPSNIKFYRSQSTSKCIDSSLHWGLWQTIFRWAHMNFSQMQCTYEMCTLTMQCQAVELAIFDHSTSQWNPTTKTTFTTWSRIQTWNRNEREAKKKGTTNSWATKRRWYLVKNLMFTTSTNGYVPHNKKRATLQILWTESYTEFLM